MSPNLEADNLGEMFFEPSIDLWEVDGTIDFILTGGTGFDAFDTSGNARASLDIVSFTSGVG